MRNIDSVRYRSRLNHLFEQISAVDDIELMSHWARYLCVLLSGFIETSLQSIYCDYARRTSNTCVTNYVASKLRRFTNPNMQDILSLVSAFNPKWREDLENVTTEEIKDSIDSVIANRNQIAHGGDVGITYTRVKRYYENVIKLIDLIESNCI